MPKEYYVLRGNKVVFAPGHYDLESAQTVAMMELKQHPKSEIKIVQIIEAYANPRKEKKDDCFRGTSI